MRSRRAYAYNFQYSSSPSNTLQNTGFTYDSPVLLTAPTSFVPDSCADDLLRGLHRRISGPNTGLYEVFFTSNNGVGFIFTAP